MTWIFRGHKSANYELAPSVERAAPDLPLPWKALESELLKEFQAKAPLHISPERLPHADDKLSWLALMQHYGVPTRLLDFTYSPYVALYFALRDRSMEESSPEVWAIDLAALTRAATRRCRHADEAYRKEDLGTPVTPVNWKLLAMTMVDERFSPTEHGILQSEDQEREAQISIALDPDPVRQDSFNGNGLVVSALPKIESQRLSSQQGLFLFSGADRTTFAESLEQMMKGTQSWCRRIRLDPQILSEVEGRLFQMNIHQLSLFPDLEGLAGFVRQKMQLLWSGGPTRAASHTASAKSQSGRSPAPRGSRAKRSPSAPARTAPTKPRAARHR